MAGWLLIQISPFLSISFSLTFNHNKIFFQAYSCSIDPAKCSTPNTFVDTVSNKTIITINLLVNSLVTMFVSLRYSKFYA